MHGKVNKHSVNFDLSSNLGETSPNTNVNSRPKTQNEMIGETQTIISSIKSARPTIPAIDYSAVLLDVKQELINEKSKA